MIRVSVTIGLLCWAQVALADCPGNISDLKGIELSRAQPFFGNVYRQTPEGLSEARIMERDGAVEEVSTIYQHPLAPGQRISEKGTLVLVYSADPAELQRLVDTKVWVSEVALTVNGQTVLKGRAEKRLAGTETMTVGDCQTDVWLVEDRLELGQGDGSWMLLSYAPDLGLVVRSVTMSADGTPAGAVEFDTIRVLTD
jgi:hypothetical protein